MKLVKKLIEYGFNLEQLPEDLRQAARTLSGAEESQKTALLDKVTFDSISTLFPADPAVERVMGEDQEDSNQGFATTGLGDEGLVVDRDPNENALEPARMDDGGQAGGYAGGEARAGEKYELWFEEKGPIDVYKAGAGRRAVLDRMAWSMGAKDLKYLYHSDEETAFELVGENFSSHPLERKMQEHLRMRFKEERMGIHNVSVVHIPTIVLRNVEMMLRYPKLTPFKDGGGIGEAVTEAGETATDKERALLNFRDQVRMGETVGVIQMYEDAARQAGASEKEIEDSRHRASRYRIKKAENGMATGSYESELEKGIKIEQEHRDLYDFLISKLGSLPISEWEFYAMIAKAHLREIPNYYTLLDEMESNATENVLLDREDSFADGGDLEAPKGRLLAMFHDWLIFESADKEVIRQGLDAVRYTSAAAPSRYIQRLWPTYKEQFKKWMKEHPEVRYSESAVVDNDFANGGEISREKMINQVLADENSLSKYSRSELNSMTDEKLKQAYYNSLSPNLRGLNYADGGDIQKFLGGGSLYLDENEKKNKLLRTLQIVIKDLHKLVDTRPLTESEETLLWQARKILAVYTVKAQHPTYGPSFKEITETFKHGKIADGGKMADGGQAGEATEVTLEDINKILDHNDMQGRIETGYRYWGHSFITAPYMKGGDRYTRLNKIASRIRHIQENTDSSEYTKAGVRPFGAVYQLEEDYKRDKKKNAKFLYEKLKGEKFADGGQAGSWSQIEQNEKEFEATMKHLGIPKAEWEQYRQDFMADGGEAGGKDKRYTVTVDFYEYAKDDEEVKRKAQEFVGDLRNRLDNQAQVLSISETPFASMSSRELTDVPKYENGAATKERKS